MVSVVDSTQSVCEVSTLFAMLCCESIVIMYNSWEEPQGYGETIVHCPCTITPAKHMSGNMGLQHFHPSTVRRLMELKCLGYFLQTLYSMYVQWLIIMGNVLEDGKQDKTWDVFLIMVSRNCALLLKLCHFNCVSEVPSGLHTSFFLKKERAVEHLIPTFEFLWGDLVILLLVSGGLPSCNINLLLSIQCCVSRKWTTRSVEGGHDCSLLEYVNQGWSYFISKKDKEICNISDVIYHSPYPMPLLKIDKK